MDSKKTPRNNSNRAARREAERAAARATRKQGPNYPLVMTASLGRANSSEPALDIAPGETVHVRFVEAFVTAQEVGTQDEHLDAVMDFTVTVGSEHRRASCRVKQVVGSGYHEDDHLELVTISPSVERSIDRGQLRQMAEAYMNMLVGPRAQIIRMSYNSSATFANNRFVVLYDGSYVARNPYERSTSG